MFLNSGIYGLMRQVCQHFKPEVIRVALWEMLFFNKSRPDIAFPFVRFQQTATRQKVLGLVWVACTFVEPVSDPVEDDAFLPGGREPEGVALDVRLVVDVVFKYVDLWNRHKATTSKDKAGTGQ